MQENKKVRSKKLEWAKHQKRWFGKWHLYLGVFAGLFVSILGLTGSILVFQDEIDHTLNPELFQVLEKQHKLSFEEVVPIVKSKYPSLKISSIKRDSENSPNLSYQITTSKKGGRGNETETFINPYTGEITGKRVYQSTFIRVVTDIHSSLMMSLAGRLITGFSSLSLIILTISGLRLWIPKKRKQLKTSLTVKFSAGFKRQNYDWHNIIGLYSAPIVVSLAITGFCMAFAIAIFPILFKLNGEKFESLVKSLTSKSTYHSKSIQLPISKIIEISKIQRPGNYVQGIRFPMDKTGTFSLDLLSRLNGRPTLKEVLVIDQYSGKVLFDSKKDMGQIGNAFIGWLIPVHYGSFGGRPTQIVAFIAGLIPFILFITGIIIWWPRYKKQKRNNRDTQSALPEMEDVSRIKIERPPLFSSFGRSVKNGLRYALWTAFISMIVGALYGAPSGIIIQPAVLIFYLCTGVVILNFIVALIILIVSLIGSLIIRIKIKRYPHGPTRYFALSLSFIVVFVPLFFLLSKSGLKIF